MSKTLAASDRCPIEIGINILSGKWNLIIIWIISKGTVRFNELQRKLNGITTKTLTDQLRKLEDEKIINRKIYGEVPPRVEYSLTDIGKNIKPVLESLCEFGNIYKDEMQL